MFEELLTISQEILDREKIEDILEDVAEAITQVSPFRRAIISLYNGPIDPSDPEERKVVDFSFSGFTDQEEGLKKLASGEIPVNLDKFDEKFILSNSYYIPHSQKPQSMKDREIKSRVPEEEMVDWHPDDSLFIPLYQKGKIIGHLSVDDPADGRAPTKGRLKPMESFANLAAIALGKAGRIKKVEEQKEKIKGLHSIGVELSWVKEPGTMLERILQILRKDFHYHYGAVLLKEGGYLVLRTQQSLCQEDLVHKDKKKLKIGEEGITGWVAKEGKPALVNQVSENSRYIPGLRGIKSELAVPIQAGDELLGVLDIESQEREAFTEEDLELLTSIAGQLAVALSNLKSKEELRRQAIRDDLTGCYNRRYFYEVLEKEIGRTKRYGGKLSLLLLDIDHLKLVNDTHGHQVGDQVLEELGRLLRNNSRISDHLYRYGGDEFTAILPETSSKDARRVAKRLIKGVDSYVFGCGTKITASCGLSSIPEDGEDPDDLIKMADRRVYLAKKEGGNQVVSQ